ncbi:MAG: hypothetical protein NTZ65_04440 [Candidatus Berkelbacteria bacterium]|nr:hypothetical protein [Candidatus Berkelbacteria bacterium]
MKTKNRIALILLILAIIIAVGSLFYAKKIKKDTNNSPATASQTVSNSSSIESSGVSSATQVAAIWPKYTNSKYGFEISFSDIWKNYKLVENLTNGSFEVKIDFNLATTDTKYENKIATPISIFVYKSSVFNALSDNEKSVKITSNSDYVFSYKTWNEPPSDLQGFTDKELADTIKSFKLK